MLCEASSKQPDVDEESRYRKQRCGSTEFALYYLEGKPGRAEQEGHVDEPHAPPTGSEQAQGVDEVGDRPLVVPAIQVGDLPRQYSLAHVGERACVPSRRGYERDTGHDHKSGYHTHPSYDERSVQTFSG